MPGSSQDETLTTWETLSVAVEASMPDLDFLGSTRAELVTTLQNAKEARLHRDALSDAMRKATHDFICQLVRGRELASRLSNGIRSHYGIASPELTKFGLKPRAKTRARPRRKPACPPVPVIPASSGSPIKE